ncbi:zinc finger c-x8-C-x5-C-x3-H type (and similar) domain-containing protein [Ditylenchus destructor]|uniref:Zinc finger c-x8-C-x5-C-x3-H type (And similar) domain-containing protein n=1 Tax=Ditylenchus destructor TaxID=166010 RepID=A0AAD4R3S3_9BILA|nr:zinc finger c-x8-C-x5-C-x3-H type (and similar) domain-containing protein [Ditylenchus destructor]
MSDEPVIFRRSGVAARQAGLRKRREKSESPSPSNEDEDFDKDEMIEATSAVQKRRQLRRKNMIHTTNKKRRNDLDNLAMTSSDSEEESTADKFAPEVKFAASGIAERAGPRDMGATARSEIDTDHTHDAQAQFERVQKLLKEEEEGGEGTSSVKTYKGMAMYGAKKKEDTVKGSASSGLNRLGPIRATQYMRANVRWDYAPDICKDYKETGFCTFGDSCKFMHDRSDYKHGWEIERDWEAGKLKEAKDDEYAITSDEDEDKDTLPHSCFICRNGFKNPVITKCKHYFCETCAIEQYRKTKKCAVCGTNTEGVFSVAKDIIVKMKSNQQKKTEVASDDEEGETVETRVLPTEIEHEFNEDQDVEDDSEEVHVKNEEDNVEEEN